MYSSRVRTVILVLCCAASLVHANGLVITNVALTNISGGSADIQFDLSWSNSWYSVVPEVGPLNVSSRDAAWVFAKFRVSGGSWKHAFLSSSNHTATGSTLIDVGANGGVTNVGVFIRRASESSGTQNCPGMRLRWDYTLNGLAGTNTVDICVLGIEMAYSDTGSFYVGLGRDRGTFYPAGSPSVPYLVQNESALSYGTNSGYLSHTNIGTTYGDLLGPVPAAFPKGYGAFYCMKYEISQGQYTDFLQLLDAGLAQTHFPNRAGNFRHTIGWNGVAYTNGAPDRACNYLTWANIRTYLDWAGLRPLTELEFEKACRGPLTANLGEFAWGDAAYVRATGFSGVDGSGAETVSPANANIFTDNGYSSGPARVGIFATASTIRRTAGSAYNGAMEMSGNLWEIVVTMGNPTGRLFTGQHGDGDPSTSLDTWPTNITGMGVRGGSYDSATNRCQTADRWFITDASYYSSTPFAGAGGRGARTAP
jgi:formylglycine-generating enzyme required for sulfatase activity